MFTRVKCAVQSTKTSRAVALSYSVAIRPLENLCQFVTSTEPLQIGLFSAAPIISSEICHFLIINYCTSLNRKCALSQICIKTYFSKCSFAGMRSFCFAKLIKSYLLESLRRIASSLFSLSSPNETAVK